MVLILKTITEAPQIKQHEQITIKCQLNTADIYFIQTVTGYKTFLYSKDNVFESNLEPYQLKKMLQNNKFVSISASKKINLDKIKDIFFIGPKSIEITLANNMKIKVSGIYVKYLIQLLHNNF